MNDEKFGLQNLKVEIQKGEPNNSDILQNCFPHQKLSPPSSICKIFKALREVPPNHGECIKV